MIELNGEALEILMSTWREILLKKKINKSGGQKQLKEETLLLFKIVAVMSALMKTVWIRYLDAARLLAGQPSV